MTLPSSPEDTDIENIAPRKWQHRADASYETLEPLRKILVFAFLFAATWYFSWRLGSFNKDAIWFSRLLYVAEIYGLATTLMHIFITWRLTVREAPEPERGLAVDVFVPTINEPVPLLRKTLLAVLRMEYPHRTWLLDDGRRPEMEALCAELGCGYLSRGDNLDAKAGNLNNALRHSSGDFIAVFDADHAPRKDFLTSTLGYFRDRAVAFVQTPQDFYNLNSFQHHRKRGRADAWHEQSVFFRVIQRGKDYWNSAFFCGSCAVIRRSALDEIGGFATGTVTEDLHTSVRIHKKGFRSVYHAEPLAFGLAPLGVVPFLKQRIRWGQGAMQVWRKEGVFFCRGLTLAQRINYLASSITYFDGWQKGLFYVTPALVLVLGVMPIAAFGHDFLLHFIPYFILCFWVFEEVNRGYGRSLVIEQYNMSRFAAMAWSTLGIFKNMISFAVTPKEGGRQRRFKSHIAPQAVVMAANALAIPVGLYLYRSGHHLPFNALAANIIWCAVNAALAIGVIQFTASHSRQSRRDYRFNIPLPARVHFPDGTGVNGTVDDISSTGCRIYCPVPREVAAGTVVLGTISLPSGALSFRAVVRGLVQGDDGSEVYTKSIGCSFQWENGDDRDSLDTFLYGSDLQLQINRPAEVIRTPFNLLGMRRSLHDLSSRDGGLKWNAIDYGVEGAPSGTGLISTPLNGSGARKLLTFAPIAAQSRISLRIYGRREVTQLTGFAEECIEVETQLSPLYQFQLREA